MLPHASPSPMGEKVLAGDSAGSVFVHGNTQREILFFLLVVKADIPKIVGMTGCKVFEIIEVADLFLASLADIRACSKCGRRFASLAYSDSKCPVCSFVFDDV